MNPFQVTVETGYTLTLVYPFDYEAGDSTVTINQTHVSSKGVTRATGYRRYNRDGNRITTDVSIIGPGSLCPQPVWDRIMATKELMLG
jgi:hypothetical protein